MGGTAQGRLCPPYDSNFKQPRRSQACLHDLAARPRESCHQPSAPKTEGAGNAGRALRPQPCVRDEKAHKHSHHGHTGNARHSPRNGFNGFLRALPGDRAFLSPSPAGLPADLTPASRRQDHTTSPSASRAIVESATRVHRIPRPTSVTIAKRPSYGTGRSTHEVIWARREEKYFC